MVFWFILPFSESPIYFWKLWTAFAKESVKMIELSLISKSFESTKYFFRLNKQESLSSTERIFLFIIINGKPPLFWIVRYAFNCSLNRILYWFTGSCNFCKVQRTPTNQWQLDNFSFYEEWTIRGRRLFWLCHRKPFQRIWRKLWSVINLIAQPFLYLSKPTWKSNLVLKNF